MWQWQKVQNQLKRHMLSIENRALISDSSSCLLDMDESSSRPSKIENYRYQLCICHFLFHTAVLQYTQLLICCFNFCWIRILNNNSESGSRKKFNFHVDPDPHHCFIRFFSRSFLMVRIFFMDVFKEFRIWKQKNCSGSNQSDSLFEAYLELVKSNLSNLLGSKTISRIQLNSDLILIVFFKDICK